MLNANIYTTGNPEFLNYLCKKSQYGMFVLPNFEQKGYNEKFWLKLRKNIKLKPTDDFRSYCKNCKDLIEAVKPDMIQHYASNEFMDSIYNHALDIYVFNINADFQKVVVTKGSLSNWLYPDMPEDLCLFDSEKRPVLITLTHERLCYVHQETREERRRIEQMGVSFVHCEEDEEQ